MTHRALTGPMHDTEAEIRYTLTSIQEVRSKLDRNELATVRKARQAGLSWTDIATCLGVTRQAAWERWHELDDAR